MPISLPSTANGRHPVGHQGRQAAGRPPEHDPGLERRRPAALLPDQLRAATGATGSVICSGSWPRPRPAPTDGAPPAAPAPGAADGPSIRPRAPRFAGPAATGSGPRTAGRPARRRAPPARPDRRRLDQPAGQRRTTTPTIAFEAAVRRRPRRLRPSPRRRLGAPRRSTEPARGRRGVDVAGRTAPGRPAAPVRDPRPGLGLAAGRTRAEPARRCRPCSWPTCRTTADAAGRCPTAAPSSPSPSPGPRARGASCWSSARPPARSAPHDLEVGAGRAPTASGPSSAAPGAPTRSPTCSTGPRRCAGSPATSAAGSISIGS